MLPWACWQSGHWLWWGTVAGQQLPLLPAAGPAAAVAAYDMPVDVVQLAGLAAVVELPFAAADVRVAAADVRVAAADVRVAVAVVG